MKKLLLIFVLILFPIFSYAEDQLAMMVISGAGTAPVDYTADPNCQGVWFMNSATGASEIDRSGNGNDLSDNSNVQSDAVHIPPGYSGKSKNFPEGAASYLSRADGSLVGLDINGADAKLSIVSWIRVASVPGSGIGIVIVSKHDSGTSQRQYQAAITGTGSSKFKFSLYLSQDSTTGGGSSVQTHSTTTTYAGNTWYHVAFVYNDVDVRIYVNGSLDCTPNAKSNGIFNGNAAFLINHGSANLAGQIDEVGVFDRELLDTEVLDIYTNGISGNKGLSD